jgi:hypothetical protein
MPSSDLPLKVANICKKKFHESSQAMTKHLFKNNCRTWQSIYLRQNMKERLQKLSKRCQTRIEIVTNLLFASWGSNSPWWQSIFSIFRFFRWKIRIGFLPPQNDPTKWPRPTWNDFILASWKNHFWELNA